MSRRPLEHAGRARASAWAAFAALLAVAAWLRLDQLGTQTLLDDEWHAVHQVVRSSPLQFMRSHGANDYSIPLTLYQWLLSRTIGLSEFGMRLPSLLGGLASIALLPWALRGRQPLRVLLVFAALLVASPLLATYARTARPYALTLPLAYVALAALARAWTAERFAWRWGALYAVAAALCVWLHAVTLPFVCAPLLVLAMARGRGPAGARLPIGWWLLSGALLALALLPPLLGDAGALASKAGRDGVRLATLQGVWHVWLGTGSVIAVGAGLVLAALGAARLWRTDLVVRWALLGLAGTVLAIVLVRPAWVFNPLTFGRYLLPALPLLLLAVAVGLDRVADAVSRIRSRAAGGASSQGPTRAPTRARAALLGALTALGVLAWWPTTPWPALLQRPNSEQLNYYTQFDYRRAHNPVVAQFEERPLPPFWRSLASDPPASLRIAVTPFQYHSGGWMAPMWQRASGQVIVPGYLSGACVPWVHGEVPRDARFRFTHAVHLADAQGGAQALRARGIDIVAFDRTAKVLDEREAWRLVPECEAWLRARLGTPSYEDAELLAWRLEARGAER